jgi:ribosomal-protein-serine acetyltransferase
MISGRRFRYIIDQETELRLLEEEHTEELYALTEENREYLREWLAWVDNIESVSDTRRYIQSAVHQFNDDRGFQAGIWFQGNLAGIIGYQNMDWLNRSAAVGYWVGAGFQGNGLATNACGALVDWAFREWRLNRVEIRCAVENHRSRAIPERLGFTEEGMAYQAEWLYDGFVDLVIYGILARDWNKINSKLKVAGSLNRSP